MKVQKRALVKESLAAEAPVCAEDKRWEFCRDMPIFFREVKILKDHPVSKMLSVVAICDGSVSFLSYDEARKVLLTEREYHEYASKVAGSESLADAYRRVIPSVTSLAVDDPVCFNAPRRGRYRGDMIYFNHPLSGERGPYLFGRVKNKTASRVSVAVYSRSYSRVITWRMHYSSLIKLGDISELPKDIQDEYKELDSKVGY